MVTLRTIDTGAVVRYTTDGTDPTPTSKLFTPGSKLLLDSTTDLRAQAFPTSSSLLASGMREDKYILNPSTPWATPGAAQPFANSVSVTLTCRSKKSEIRYWTGATLPNLPFSTLYDGKPIPINSTMRLQAVAVTNSGGQQRVSSILDLTYEIYTTTPSDTLLAGATRTLTGGFVFTNLSDTPVSAKTHTTADFSLFGFRDASLAIRIKPTAPGQAVKVSYSKPADLAVSLYRYVNGGVEYLSSDSHFDLTAGGDYFIGVDTLPPILTLISQQAMAGDSTLLTLSVQDNIINPTCKIQSSGLTGGESTRKPGADGSVIASLKFSGTDLKGLWFRASAGDFYSTAHLPADPLGKIYVPQTWNKLNTPAVLTVGKQGAPWDMAGFPVSASAPILWGKVLQDNPDAELQAMVWSDVAQDNLPLSDSSVIKPGMAFWMGSTKLRNSVAMTGFNGAQSEIDGSCRMVLHNGWNQVTSPLLDKMYWPVTTRKSKAGEGLLKAPYRYLPKIHDYAQVDSLEPWVGYFVYYYGARDTTVTLLTDASKRLPKSAAESPDAAHSVAIALDFGRPDPLYLGARSWAEDGVGAEDEPDLPAFQRTFSAWSQRGKGRLLTDLVKFGSGELMHWNVVLDDAAREGGSLSGVSTIKVLEGSMPEGYQAWAVSTARGLKFRLESGSEMPWSGMASDTLSVYAGPAAKLAGIVELSRAVSTVDGFTFALEKDPAGSHLRIALPWNSAVDAEIWSLSGRLLAQSHPGRLNPGVYRLRLSADHGPNSDNRVGVLKIRLRTESGPREFSRKVLW